MTHREAMANKRRADVLFIVLCELVFYKNNDFCTIFYNVLQTAIEASKALEEGLREVSVEVKNVGDKSGILISNNTLLDKIPTEKERRFTTKKDKNNHGFGIQNIKDVVQKHNGIYEARIADSRYIVTIVI